MVGTALERDRHNATALARDRTFQLLGFLPLGDRGLQDDRVGGLNGGDTTPVGSRPKAKHDPLCSGKDAIHYHSADGSINIGSVYPG